MREILIACGDVELLKRLIAELPARDYKPIATKRGHGVAAKIAGRGVAEAIVHAELEGDCSAAQLIEELSALRGAPPVLLLYGGPKPPEEAAQTAGALRYPCPGPVLRHALERIAPAAQGEQDLEAWRLFYRDLKRRNAERGAQSYYALLGLAEGAPHHELVRAFDALSLRYHPDRYQACREERWGEAIYQEANALYKAMTQAYGVLSERKTRALYDSRLSEGQLRLNVAEAQALKQAGPRSIEELGQSEACRRFLKLAQTDVATRSWQRALQNLRFAQSMEPDNGAIAEKIAEIEAKL